jgi:hypothetical protein
MEIFRPVSHEIVRAEERRIAAPQKWSATWNGEEFEKTFFT